MISVKEARQLVSQHLLTFAKEQVPIDACMNRVLSEDVRSPIDHPLLSVSGRHPSTALLAPLT